MTWWEWAFISSAYAAAFGSWAAWWVGRRARRREAREQRAHLMTLQVVDAFGNVLINADCEQLQLIHRYSLARDREEWFELENIAGFSLQVRPTHP